MRAQIGSRVIDTLLNLGIRCGWVVNTTPHLLYPGKDTRYPLYRRLGGPIWMGRENVNPTGVRTPNIGNGL